jgi:hypothetical protein
MGAGAGLGTEGRRVARPEVFIRDLDPGLAAPTVAESFDGPLARLKLCCPERSELPGFLRIGRTHLLSQSARLD